MLNGLDQDQDRRFGLGPNSLQRLLELTTDCQLIHTLNYKRLPTLKDTSARFDCFQRAFWQNQNALIEEPDAHLGEHISKWTSTQENQTLLYVNNRCADLASNPHSLISPFAVRLLES